jgi:hypothetical protein
MARKKNTGFTLIEFLIYSIIVTIIVGSLVLMSINVLAARGRMVAAEEVSHNARFALGKIMYEIRQAEQITSPAPGATDSSLSLIAADGDTLVFSLEEVEDVLEMTIGGGTPFSLTSESIAVSSLTFANISYTDTSGTVRIEMTLEYINPLERTEWEFQRTFYATENIRR